MPSSPSAPKFVGCASPEDMKQDRRNGPQHDWAVLAISIVDLPRTAIAIVCTANQGPSPFAELAKQPATACSGPGRSLLPRTVRHHNVVELSEVTRRSGRSIEVLIPGGHPLRLRMGRTLSHSKGPK